MNYSYTPRWIPYTHHMNSSKLHTLWIPHKHYEFLIHTLWILHTHICEFLIHLSRKSLCHSYMNYSYTSLNTTYIRLWIPNTYLYEFLIHTLLYECLIHSSMHSSYRLLWIHHTPLWIRHADLYVVIIRTSLNSSCTSLWIIYTHIKEIFIHPSIHPSRKSLPPI